MRITFILPFTDIGGGTRAVFEYANRLEERGHEVSIVYPVIPLRIGTKWYDPLKAGGQVIGLLRNLTRGNRIHWLNVSARLVRVLTLSPKFLRLFANTIGDGDIVVATSWETAYAVNELPRRKGERFYLVQGYEVWDFWEEEECWEEAGRLESDPARLGIAMSRIDAARYGFKHFKALVDKTYKLPLRKVTVSSWLKNLMEEGLGERVETVITPVVNLDQFHNENKKYSRRKRILLLYHRTRLKGVDDGIRAFEIARERHPEIQLVMFGVHRGPNIPGYAEFHDKPIGEDLRRLYCSCDIFVWPSWIEGFGLPPMEAMACKCVLVATSVGAIPSYTIPGETALISPPRHPELLAFNITKLLEDDSLLRRISEAGYDHIRNFTWDRATDELEHAFESALK